MSKLTAHFSTDWSAMTGSDWAGMTMNVLIFLLMLAAYIYAFKPGNKESLEAHRNFVLNDDSSNREDDDGR